jgi:predicted phosphodiesterase
LTRQTIFIGATLAFMLGVLCDIHGNLPALDAVLADAEQAGVDRWLLGGDYGTPSPWAIETLARLRELPNAVWIRGNGERWLVEPPVDRPEVMEVYEIFRGQMPEEDVKWLYDLPTQAELDGILYVHGSPLSDVDSFAPEPQEGEERLLAGVHDRTVVFGHSHQQFRRPGPANTDLVNPGSAGMPLDGDVRAAWATRDDDFEFRRVEYDVERAAAGYRLLGGGEFAEIMARRIERGSD